MYVKSARYFDALYHFLDYREAAVNIETYIQQRNPGAKTLLDVGCGTGKHLEFLSQKFQAQGLDLNADLLNIARQRCPEVDFHQSDMANFSLGTTFDVVTCLFSSIGHVKTVENMYSAIACMSKHLNPHGVILMEPWFSPANYLVGRITANFVDQSDLKIAWMCVSALEKNVSILDYNFMVGTPEGINYFTERHELGLFTPEEYKDAFHAAGMEVEHNPQSFFKNRGAGAYIAKKL